MPTSVTMPALGESVTEGTVTRWLKQEGEQVEVDEPLLEVSTDKVDTEIPSPAAGVLTKILVAEDETVEVGAELAVIGGEGDGGGAPAQEAAPGRGAAPQTPDQQRGAGRRAGAGARRGAGRPRPSPRRPPSDGGGRRRQGGGEGTPVTMPALGESVTEGTVTRWLKQEGEQVEVDEPLLEVSTDKVDTEIPSPAAGVLTKILVAEDETVEVGAQLALIGAWRWRRCAAAAGGTPGSGAEAGGPCAGGAEAGAADAGSGPACLRSARWRLRLERCAAGAVPHRPGAGARGGSPRLSPPAVTGAAAT